MMTSIAFKLYQLKYGEGVCNIELVEDMEVSDFLHQVYPAGTKNNLDLKVLEEYGLAVNVAKLLQGQGKFVLSAPQGGMVNVFCGRIPNLRTVSAKIIIDRSTVRFLAGWLSPFLSFTEGSPIAAARVKESVVNTTTLLNIYFCGELIPLP